MRYLSAEFTNRLANNSTLTAKATVRFADGTSRELAGEDFCSLGVEQASSSSGSFDIGAAVVGQLTCALNNYDDRFSECDFEGAAMTVWVGATLPSGNEEWVKLGVYYVDRPDSYAGQISLTALDCLSLLEKDYSPSTFSSWPKTLQQIADAGCLACGLMNDTTEIPNGSYSVASEPELDGATWLDVMGYVAQATGTFVRATDDGHVEFAWYDTSAFESEDWNDGGSFDSASPYATGDAADGGNLTDYSSGDSMDGGEFSAARRLGVVNRFFSLTVFTDDVVITGVSVTAQNQVIRNSDGSESNGEDGETALYGSEGYVLSLADNPLVLYGQAASVASQVGKRVVGMSLRPFSCDAVTDPSIEPGDAVLVYDRKGNEYRSYVTSTNIAVNGSESIECGAQSSSRNSAGSASAATKAIVKARNDLNREKTSRQKAIEDLTEKISESSGLFSTTVTLPDGSSVVYLHDKSDLQSSKIVWKMTAEAVAVSTSGPEGPYATGLTADGTAILDRIYAVGINADYISDGALEDGTGKNYWNLKTGELRMTGYAKDSETISSVDVEYAQNQSATTAPTSGWQTTAPAYKSGYYIWSRTKTVNADGSASYSAAVMISGRDGDTGATGTGVSAIAEQYYLSTSKTAQSGGSWSETQPAYVSGRYYWTRSKVTWTDGKVTYATPVLAQGVNNANEEAEKASGAVAALSTQEAIFNLLTKNGTIDGLYMKDGKLYVNASYIGSGVYQIQDSSGKVIVKLGSDVENGIQVYDKFTDSFASLAWTAIRSNLVIPLEENFIHSYTARPTSGGNSYSGSTELDLLEFVDQSDTPIFAGNTGRVRIGVSILASDQLSVVLRATTFTGTKTAKYNCQMRYILSASWVRSDGTTYSDSNSIVMESKSAQLSITSGQTHDEGFSHNEDYRQAFLVLDGLEPGTVVELTELKIFANVSGAYIQDFSPYGTTYAGATQMLCSISGRAELIEFTPF